MKERIGTQFFGLWKELIADFGGTIDAVAEIGFEIGEPLIFLAEEQGEMPKNLWSFPLLEEGWKRMEAKGLAMPSAHVGAAFNEDGTFPYDMMQDSLLRIREITGTENFIFSGMFTSADGAKQWGEAMGSLAERVKPYGCRIVYHNHDDEMIPMEDKGVSRCGLDIFYDVAGPDVLMQLDIGWAALTYGEIEAAKHYADRILEIHLKDLSAEVLAQKISRTQIAPEQFRAIGEGGVKTKAVLDMRSELPIFNGAIIIDQDQTAGSMLEDLTIGYRNVKRFL